MNLLIVGSLSNNNGNGSENVTKKAGFVLFQTFFLLFHFIQLFQCWGILIEWILKDCIFRSSQEEKEHLFFCVHVLHET